MRISRRTLVSQFVVFASSLLVFPCHRSNAQWPSDTGTGTKAGGWPEARNQNNGPRAVGCALYGVNDRSVSQHFNGFSRHSGIPQLDGVMNFEPRVLRDFIGYNPAFAFFDDRSGPNAFATPERLLGSPDGTVMFGRTLLRSEISNNPFWDAAVVGILAHEWGHISQFHRIPDPRPGRGMELHADFIAGWYLGFKAKHGSRFEIRGLAASLFEKGDYEFNSPIHHGTPDERVQAMVAGFEAGLYNHAPTFDDAFEEGRDLLD